jgi:uncharacterized protein YuzE
MSQLWYDAEEDILGIQLDDRKKYWKSVEIAPNVIVDLAKTGEITGVEILKAKDRSRRMTFRL